MALRTIGAVRACAINRKGMAKHVRVADSREAAATVEHRAKAAIARRRVMRALGILLLLGAAQAAHAGTVFCSQFPLVGQFHVIDGNDPSLTPATLPSSITIDQSCYFKNFPISSKWPNGLTSTVNFKQYPYPTLAIFENVYYGGNMACSNTDTKIWFVNNATYAANNSCQSLFIPVETIGKATPGPTATVGVPFTYTLTVPVMYDPSTNTYYDNPSANTLSNATIYDDLTTTGADMTYVSNTAYTVDTSGVKTAIGPLNLFIGTKDLGTETVTGDNTKHLIFDYSNNSSLRNIPAGTQVVVELTVVLDNTSNNVAGTQFINTAKWWFGRVIDGVAYAPLPGQSGVSAPMTVAEPDFVVNKTATTSNLNVGTSDTFTVDAQNVGGSDAWYATVSDNIPAGMCIYDPRPTVTASIVHADGTTTALSPSADYTMSWNGGAATSPCTLSLTMNTAKGTIGPNEHLIVTYDGKLDAGTSAGSTFANVAGVTQWFGGDTSTYTSGLRAYTRTLQDAATAAASPDYEDSFTVTSVTTGYYFLKTAEDVTTGVLEDSTNGLSAFPGDTIRYTLQIQNFNVPILDNISITDDLGDVTLNPTTAFQPGSLSLVSTNLPGGTYAISPNGGTGGVGQVSINGLTLPSDTQYYITFDIKLSSALTKGTVVKNQATLNASGYSNSASDDPFVNGPALLQDNVAGDPTPLTIQTPAALSKTNPTKAWATIGDTFTYQVKVPATPVNVPLYDVKIFDQLTSSNADLSYVGASVVSGGTWSLVNTGTATSPVIEDQATGIDIPAGGQAVVNVTVQMKNTTKNVDGLTFNNTAYYTYDKVNGDTTTQATGGSATTANMTVYEPDLSATKTVSYASPSGKATSSPAAVGDVLQYTVTVKNNSSHATAYDADILDSLPSNLSLVANSASVTINGTTVSGFVATPTTLSSGALVWGYQNGDGSLDIPANGTLVLTYQAQVLAANGTTISNSAYVDWSSINGTNTEERNGNGCPTTTAPNTYCFGPVSTSVGSVDPTALAKSVVSDTWTTSPSNATDSTVRIGDTVVYNLAVTLREGTTNNVVVTDALPAGLAFDGTISITPASGSSVFTYSVASQPTVGDTGTVSWNLGTVDNAVDNDLTNNTLIIQFRARVMNNTLPTAPTPQTLNNAATLTYNIGGTAGTAKTSSADIYVWQPSLTITKSAAPAGGNNVIGAGEGVSYTVRITNNGTATAYDPVLQDTLPVGMRAAGVSMGSIYLTDGTTTTALTARAPTYDPATGVATWDLDTGTANEYAIPPNYTLVVQYKVTADSTLGTGMTLTNQAQVTHYYSFDSADIPTGSALNDRQDYGQTSAAKTTLTTAAALALSKQALVSQAAIGQPFTYRITVPASAQTTALYDVHVLDDISQAATGVSLSYVSASAHLASNTKSWSSLTNIGSATNLELVDNASGGLDIPANDQLIVDITVVLTDDTTNNTPGKSFTNTANYTYDVINDDTGTVTNGAAGASGAVTIVAPNLIMTKSGPANMRLGVAGAFTLDIQNNGGADAWDTVITDVLPYVTTSPSGGMCSAAPNIVSAGIYDSTGTTLVKSLTNGTDFNVNFVGAPTCTYTITMTSTGVIPAGDHLIINYSTSLDPGTATNMSLTNIAGATQYKSADPSGSGFVHTYSNTLGTATEATASNTDFQDAFTVVTTAPTLVFTKDVYDVTRSSPGTSAHPGDTLRYTLTINNTGTVDANNFNLTDDLDNLNSTAMFAPGSLVVTSIPSGATDASNAGGGSKGTGYVSISGLTVPAGASITIEYTVQLVPVIDNGTVVLNQAQIAAPTIVTQLSDDPNTTTADDPTHTTINSAPKFQIYKTSADLTGSSTILLAGDTLRYTITVNNVGDENAINALLKDQIPASTTYVTGSTTLNGKKVSDVSGASPLQDGMLINSLADTTPGHMPADASASTANVARITFDVTINAGVVSGTVISNQGFLTGSGAGSGAFNEQPSDDPNTATLNDPTLDVIGNVPLIDAVKTVSLKTDVNGNGYVDAGDVLEYTIKVTNYGKVQASGVTLTDAVPANTTYYPNSTTLNTLAVAEPTPGVSPLAAGISINSSDTTIPGELSPGGTATIVFDVTVNSTVGSGVVISNQGYVASNEQATEPTDADGNDSNGDQPTVVVTGNAQQLSITKAVSVVGGGTAVAGGKLEYLVTITNVGSVPATNVSIRDNLDEATPGYMTYDSTVPATLNGASLGVTTTATTVNADYSTTYGNLQPGQSATLRFRVDLNATLAIGTTVTNIAHTDWNLGSQTDQASVSITIGGTPGSAALNGRAWHDENFNKTYDSGETSLGNWSVELYFKGNLLATARTDTNGNYQFTGLAPNNTSTDRYELRFLAPGAGANTAKLGAADSSSTNSTYTFTDGLQRIGDIIVNSGDSLQNLNLPITPNGVVYDSIVRQPVAGATVSLLSASTSQPLSSACFDDPGQQNQVTLANGYYKFNLNFSQADCPSGVDYLIKVTPPSSYNSGESVAIPAQTDAGTGAFSVPDCVTTGNGDAVPSTADECEVQPFSGAPAMSISAGSAQTNYYLKLTLGTGTPGEQGQIFNNPIPIDPNLTNALAISKTSAKVNVTRGELVPYTITINNTLVAALNNVTIYDDFPPGFKYVKGSARVNGVAEDPTEVGNELSWPANIPSNSTYTIKLLLVVGAGVHEGKYVNRAHIYSNVTNSDASSEATATVRVVPDPTFDCSDIVGKVFDDKNLNGHQDKGEKGLGGVRLATVRGNLITTDPHGRFHLSCAAVPNEQRGSNFILKLDERSLPTGYRVTTENPRVERLTRGKAIKFDFGAALQHVVTLDLADGVFKDNSSEMRSQWVPRLALLITQLRKHPSLLRLTYLADVESKSLVNARIDAVKDRIKKRWKQVGAYSLTIETEVFWRHGGPVDREGLRQ
ncbi:MAG TPA: isopeptide-forming domain-containing fimbrial protein [Gammaproteobacteria bacterium]|nr:isopeptide-forming domain-containing fimbrial protein [Gammaproteobacteria bacterium]